ATGREHAAFSWLKYDAYDAPAMRFRKALRERGVEAAIREFDQPLRNGAIPEGSVNSVGYHLLGQKRAADAIRIFELNVSLHPQSANAYDSLGEAFLESGDKPRAIQNYEKSLALDPRNSNAAAQLAKLKAG